MGSGAEVRLESLPFCGFGSFGMSVWRSSALHFAPEGAIDVELSTWSARVLFIALDLALTAHVAGPAQARHLGIWRGGGNRSSIVR